MKIVITGAMGYIGTELCKSYFGKKNQVIGLDKRFFSDRVKTLRENDIDFIHGDVLNESLMKDLLKDADIVYHLAGTTDVAYTKFNDNDSKDVEIRTNGVDTTLIVLKYLPKKAKLIFPSTHVVFEGLEHTTLNIEEDFPTKPYLTYAQTKNQNEIDIKKSGVDYIILRLGSVYGLSTDTMRINIMPNLFSKITSQDGQITLYSGGETHKSLVNLLDVVDAMMFFADSDFKNETYHLTDENLTVKQVSEICKKYNPKVNIIQTENEISLGYSPDYNLSNKKILSTGFKFKRNIDSSIKEMIYNWTTKSNRNFIDGFSDTCRVSGSNERFNVLSLGMSPLANNLLDDKNQKIDFYPLELDYYPESHNVQLNYTVDPQKMFSNYVYVSSTTKSFRDHFEKAAEKYIKDFNLLEDSFVLDIGSNDGIALLPFKSNGVKVLGVEPAENIQKIAEERGIPTILDFFTTKTSQKILTKFGKADLVLASNVFAHSDEINEILLGVNHLLKEDGVFIVEVQYLLDTIKDLTFDNIYHEHVNYWTVHSIVNFFKKRNFNVFNIEHINTHGGSIRVYVDRGIRNTKESVQIFIQEEINFGLNKVETYIKFGKRIKKSKDNVLKNIQKFKEMRLEVVGYGSPAKATTMLNYYGITDQDIQYVVEDNQLKHYKFIPGTGIQILPKETLKEKTPDIVLVFAWNFIDEIRKNNYELIEKGVQFYSIRDLQNDYVQIKDLSKN